jgi:hypothetical protein
VRPPEAGDFAAPREPARRLPRSSPRDAS